MYEWIVFIIVSTHTHGHTLFSLPMKNDKNLPCVLLLCVLPFPDEAPGLWL